MKLLVAEFITNLNPLEIALLSCFAGLFLIRMGYEIFVAFILVFKKDKVLPSNNSLISIIMAIRNEEDSLNENLPAILNFDDPNYEVIVVDDFSQDQSLTVLGLLKANNEKLKFSSLNQEARFSTKLAQNIAMKASKGKWAMVLSPSLKMADKNWLTRMREKIGSETEVVIGYTAIEPQKGFFNLLYRIELFLQQMNSFAFIKMGMSYVVNELNVLFASQNYFDQRGFKGVMSEEYANMELIINKFIHRKKTEILFSSKGKVIHSLAVNKESFVEIKTKFEHIKKKLSFSKRMFIACNESTKFLFPIFFLLVAFLLPQLIMFTGILAGIKIILHILIVISALKRLNEQKIFIPSLLYELVAPYYKLLSRIFKRLSLKSR